MEKILPKGITAEEQDPKTRRYCHYCNKKRYVQNMVKIYYPLLKDCFWFCNECFIRRDANTILTIGTEPINKEFL